METIHQAQGTIIRPVGSLDINTSDELRRTVITALENGAETLLIDFQNVTFLDSSGLSAMVMALKKAREFNTQLSLCSVDEQAMMLFNLTGMNKVFDILEDKDTFQKPLSCVQ